MLPAWKWYNSGSHERVFHVSHGRKTKVKIEIMAGWIIRYIPQNLSGIGAKNKRPPQIMFTRDVIKAQKTSTPFSKLQIDKEIEKQLLVFIAHQNRRFFSKNIDHEANFHRFYKFIKCAPVHVKSDGCICAGQQ